jgi:hypothetical protein
MRKLFVFMIFVISCNGNTHIPSDVIRPDKMQAIFWDIIRGDILAEEIVRKDSSKNLKDEKAELTEKIFSIHKINKETFQNSLVFYEKHLDLMKTIFDSLNAKQANRNYMEFERNKHLPRKLPLSLPLIK